MKRALVVVVMVGGCASTAAQRASLIATSAMLVCDWGQTSRMAAGNWHGLTESNPVMGLRPSVSEVAMYFWSALAINALLWKVTPPRYRLAEQSAIAAVQVDSISYNASMGTGLCGL